MRAKEMATEEEGKRRRSFRKGGERRTVHKFGRIRDEREEGDSEELLGYAGSVENDIDDVDENFCRRRKVSGRSEERKEEGGTHLQR